MTPCCEFDLRLMMWWDKAAPSDVFLQANWCLTLHNAKHPQRLFFITQRFAVLFLLLGPCFTLIWLIQFDTPELLSPATVLCWSSPPHPISYRWMSLVSLLQLGKGFCPVILHPHVWRLRVHNITTGVNNRVVSGAQSLLTYLTTWKSHCQRTFG